MATFRVFAEIDGERASIIVDAQSPEKARSKAKLSLMGAKKGRFKALKIKKLSQKG